MRGWLQGVLMLSAVSVWPTAALGAEVSARLDWTRHVTLSTQVSGTVVAVPAEVGERVRKGAPLVRLDQRDFKARLAKARADVAALAASRKEAARELERAKNLYDRTVLSDHELQLARIEDVKAQAKLQAARAALTQAQLDMEHSVVRAPYEALVLRRQAALGQTVISGLKSVPLVTVAEAGRMVARAGVGADQLARLKLGQRVSVSVDKHRYEGHISQLGLDPLAGSSPVRYTVEVEFALPPGLTLRAGQAASLELP